MQARKKPTQTEMIEALQDKEFKEKLVRVYQIFKTEYLDKLDSSIRDNPRVMMSGYLSLQYIKSFNEIPLAYIMFYDRLQQLNQHNIDDEDQVKIFLPKNPHHY